MDQIKRHISQPFPNEYLGLCETEDNFSPKENLSFYDKKLNWFPFKPTCEICMLLYLSDPELVRK